MQPERAARIHRGAALRDDRRKEDRSSAGRQLGPGRGEARQGTAPRDVTWNTGEGGAGLMPPRPLRFPAAIGSAPACGKSSSGESFGVGTNSGSEWGGGAAAACGRAAWASGFAYDGRPSPALSRRPLCVDRQAQGGECTVPFQEYSSHCGHGAWERDGGTVVVTPRAARTPARSAQSSNRHCVTGAGSGQRHTPPRPPAKKTPTATGGADKHAWAPLGGRAGYSPAAEPARLHLPRSGRLCISSSNSMRAKAIMDLVFGRAVTLAL